MITDNNRILLGDINKHFTIMESHVEELKWRFNPSKLLMKSTTEVNKFNNTLININIALEFLKKELDVI